MSQNFPQLAKQAKHLAIIRSMTSKEGSHPRATYLLHTGYLPTASVKYPAFGSIAAKELEQAELRFALVRPHRQRAERQQRRACSDRTTIRS